MPPEGKVGRNPPGASQQEGHHFSCRTWLLADMRVAGLAGIHSDVLVADRADSRGAFDTQPFQFHCAGLVPFLAARLSSAVSQRMPPVLTRRPLMGYLISTGTSDLEHESPLFGCGDSTGLYGRGVSSGQPMPVTASRRPPCPAHPGGV